MRPTLRVIHHLHRTGGTLISRCVASLPDIALLSEVNPNADIEVLDPLFQASFWLRLLDDRAVDQLRGASFAEKIAAIHRRSDARGETLVLRNWAYLDFFAIPFAAEPTNELSIVKSLESEFDLKQIVTVRHPMDQLMSWQHYQGSARASSFSFAEFVDGCDRFATCTDGLPWIRYEDFVSDPATSMQQICGLLDLQYDSVFLQRWPYYQQITGDDNHRASGDWSIRARPLRRAGRSLRRQAASSQVYASLLERYGYSP